MDRKIRVAAVDYLNTKPLIWGFEQGGMKDELELTLAFPAKIADALLADDIDVGLVPVAVLPSLQEYHIISSFCIASTNEVASVCLFSDVPLSQVEYVYLDYQSRTSAALLKILLQNFWKVSPQFLPALPGYESKITGNVAALIIGDRALEIRSQISHVYDLGEAWRDMTGLPFVYAVWASNKKLPLSFTQNFDATTGAGLQHIDEIIAACPQIDYDLATYYNVNLDYIFGEREKQALQLFLKYVSDSEG